MSYQNNDQDDVLSGFNPFAPTQPVLPNAITSAPRPLFTPAILPEQPRPSINQNDKVLRDLEEKERALKDLERQIQQREEKLQALENDSKGVRINNFPPMPKWFPFRPCFYQDFDVDISPEYRYIVKFGFYIFMAYTVLLLLNLFGTLSYFIVSGNSDIGAMFGVSIAVFILMPPLSYILWFRPLYRAFRSQSSVNFFMFFLFFAILIILVIIQALGINVLGSCGWINSFIVLKINLGVSIFMIIITCGFTVIAATSIFLFIKVQRTYRSTGASFEKAKAEMRNESVSAALHT